MNITFRPGIQSPVEARFWSHVGKTQQGCWLWFGNRFKNGYGRARLSPTRTAVAHRMAWEFRHGPIPSGLLACHRCDVRQCVNPRHIFLGTYDDNNKDRMHKGRNGDTRGEKHPMAKLTESDVLKIRSKRAAGEVYSVIGKDFGITAQMAHLIATGKSWRHV